MKIVATMPVRNEDWCIGLTLRALLRWVDSVVVLDHASTDGTRQILAEIDAEHPGRVAVMTECNPVWEEMRHRQSMLDRARIEGATHIVMVDADEVLTANLVPDIRRAIAAIPRRCTFQLPWHCLRWSIQRYHHQGAWGRADVSVGYEDGPAACWKAEGGYDFHHRHPCGWPFVPFRPIRRDEGGLMHLQFVSDRRLRAKQALYLLTERLRWPGRLPAAALNAMYGLSVYDEGTATANLAPVPPEWWAGYEDLMQHLHPAAEPWQEREARRLYAEHGAAKFEGLDLFGVV